MGSLNDQLLFQSVLDVDFGLVSFIQGHCVVTLHNCPALELDLKYVLLHLIKIFSDIMLARLKELLNSRVVINMLKPFF
jgi:hypothetical protein